MFLLSAVCYLTERGCLVLLRLKAHTAEKIREALIFLLCFGVYMNKDREKNKYLRFCVYQTSQFMSLKL